MNLSMKSISLLPNLGYWLLLLIGPLPFIYFLLHYSFTLEHLKELDEKVESLHARKQQAEQLQKRQDSALTSLSQSDPYYIDKHLESLTFLESDIKKMQLLCSNSEDEMIQNRLNFLKNGANRLLFSEEKTRNNDQIKEVFEKQQHPVEINEEDLKKLLCLIEGVTIWPYGPKEGRPQLTLQDFQLSKKKYHPKDHVFIMNMNMIKREQSHDKN